jgi:hypothetical protein
MPSPYDLCTVPVLRRWLGQQSSDNDPLLAQLITAASAQIYSYLQRKLLIAHSVSLLLDGNGKHRMLLPEWPVLAVNSLSIDNVAVAPSPGFPAAGYQVDAWDGTPPGAMASIRIIAGSGIWPGTFSRGLQNVAVSFTAGYVVTKEPQTVPAAADPPGTLSVAVAEPWGPWAADSGVVYASSGVALTKVSTAPGPGQYQLDAGVPGQYLFNAADENAAILISYSYIPAAISHCCMEIAAERSVYKSHVGERASTTGGVRTTTFAAEPLSPHVKAMLDPYRRIVTF